MGDGGSCRFPGSLDPSAQEFWPGSNHMVNLQPQIPLIRHPHLFFSYPAPPQAVPYCEHPVGYASHQLIGPAAPPAAGAMGGVQQPQPPLPPPNGAPTRTLLLSSVPYEVSETVVRRELEVFGEVRGVQMERVMEGIVTVHFYDLRHAERALREIREQNMQQARLKKGNACAPLLPAARGMIAGRPVWAHFIVPASNAVPDGNNQGTIVVFNLDAGVSTAKLKEIFQAFGTVKELRETPTKKHQKFVEFYDVREAAKALREMNGKEINGKQIVLEFSRPGGYTRKFFDANNTVSIRTIPNSITLSNKHHNTRNSKYLPPPPPPSPPLGRKVSAHSPSNIPCASFVHQGQSAESSNSWEENPNDNGSNKSNSLEPSVGSLSLSGGSEEGNEEKIANGAQKRKGKKNQSTNNLSTGTTPRQQQHSRNRLWKGRQTKKFDPRFLISEDGMAESNCGDFRTTVMIKNIPNKYSQKLILNMLDNHCIHCNEQIADGDDQPLSSYDFLYLPIDFNNKCNVGYGFVNMTSPQATWRLYKAFHNQHWEVFNSRKICEISYARVQGLESLKEHFKNSKFPCETEDYLPVVFSPPRDGKQLTEPLPIVGHKQQQLIICGPSKHTEDDDEDDDDEDDDDEMNGAVTLQDHADEANDASLWNSYNIDQSEDQALTDGSSQQ